MTCTGRGKRKELGQILGMIRTSWNPRSTTQQRRYESPEKLACNSAGHNDLGYSSSSFTESGNNDDDDDDDALLWHQLLSVLPWSDQRKRKSCKVEVHQHVFYKNLKKRALNFSAKMQTGHRLTLPASCGEDVGCLRVHDCKDKRLPRTTSQNKPRQRVGVMVWDGERSSVIREGFSTSPTAGHSPDPVKVGWQSWLIVGLKRLPVKQKEVQLIFTEFL